MDDNGIVRRLMDDNGIHIIPTCSMNLETAVTMHWWSFQPSSFCSELDASMGCNRKDSFTGERSMIQSKQHWGSSAL